MFRVLAHILVLVWGGVAQAQALAPLDTAARVAWTAVGIVNNEGTLGLAQCSGVLVAPDLVLTAAHCVGSPAGPFEARRFVLGGGLAGPDTVFSSSSIELHPDFVDAPSDLARFAVDLALVTLSRPVPPALARPLPYSGLQGVVPDGAIFAVVGFDRLKPKQLNGRLDCFPARGAAPNTLQLRCPVTSGNSGAPVLIETPRGWQIVGVAAARVGRGVGSQALVALGDDWLAARISAALAR